MGQQPLRVPVRPASLLILCLFVQGWLVILHLHLTAHSNPGVAILGQPFDMLREASLPSMWAVLQALAVAATAGLVAVCMRADGVPKNNRIGWVIAAGLFTLIAMDDAGGIHERLGAITSLQLMAQLGYPSYPWHIVVAPIFAGLLFLVIYLLWGDLGKTESGRPMVVTAVVCYGVSQSIDFFEGIDRMSQGALGTIAKALPPWMVVEETLEMVGTALFLCAFLTVLVARLNGRSVSITADEPADKKVAHATAPVPPAPAMSPNR